MQTTQLFSTIQHNTICLSRQQGERKSFSSRKTCDPSSNISQLNLRWTRHVLGTWKSALCPKGTINLNTVIHMGISCTTTIYSYYNILNNIQFVYLQKTRKQNQKTVSLFLMWSLTRTSSQNHFFIAQPVVPQPDQQADLAGISSVVVI